MKLRNRKQKSVSQSRQTSTVYTQRSPVMRYYRPTDRAADTNNKPSIRLKDKNSRNSRLASSSFVSSLMNWVILGAICVLLAANSTLSNAPTIQLGNKEATAYRSPEAYKQGIAKLIDESLVNRSKLSFRSVRFEEELQKLFPELTNATAIVPLVGRNLHVELDMVTPLVRVISSQDTRIGVIGQNGRLLLLEPLSVYQETTFSPEELPSLILQPDLPLTVGQEVLTESEMELFRLLLTEFDGSTDYLPLPTQFEYTLTTREIRVRFEGVGYYAKLTPESDVRLQVGALIATLKRLYETNTQPKDYIDARVESRVFVK